MEKHRALSEGGGQRPGHSNAGYKHYFFKDLKKKDEVVREMRGFLLGK